MLIKKTSGDLRRVLNSPGTLELANSRLLAALEQSPALELDGVTFNWRHLHLGPGVYAKGFEAVIHRHDELQIEYAADGRVCFIAGGDKQMILPGQGCMIMPGVYHRWMAVDALLMAGALINVGGHAGSSFLAALNEASKKGMRVFGGKDLVAWMEQILAMAVSSGPDAWRIEIMGSLLRAWLARCFEAVFDLKPWKCPVPSAKREMNRRQVLCDTAVAFLRANYGRPLQVADVAAQVGVSPRHLNRLFCENLKDSVAGILSEIRLQKAKALLAGNPSLSVKEISYASGFSSPGHFTQKFKKRFGVVPGRVNNRA
ncbi:MAG: helix-turn-helix domain-containing protein [Verrucomicrobiae bacterium]|nr:helix-turn-helix domain-containing protein [Verrucomicrobiae bacterium]